MSGICGYIGLNNEKVLGDMLSRMVHRGPDEDGKYTELGLGLGVRRLSIIDVENGHQPATNENHTIWVILDGRIYNYRELREDLLSKGHVFKTQSDTEVLAHLYEERGKEMIPLLRGMFAIALWDAKKEVFLLIRDRLGIKPLYYSDTEEGGLVFASELEAIKEALPVSSISPQAIAQYLTLFYIAAPRTIYKGIRQLMPGQVLKDQGETRTITSYFDIQSLANQIDHKSTEQLETEFRKRLKDSVKSHMVSDVPLGLLLSDGLDSASILAMMRSVTDGPINTFSIGYKDCADSGFNETSEARILAEKFATTHTEELISPDITDLLPKVVKSMGEPFADSSAIVNYLISQVAKKYVKVALSGIGGSEIFGGHPRYLGIQMSKYYQILPSSIRAIIADRILSTSTATGNIKRFLKNGKFSLSKQYVNLLSHVPQEWTESVFADDFAKEIDTTAPLELLEGLFRNWPSSDPVDKAMGLDLQTYLPDNLLKTADRMSMANSVEMRVPFCDHELLTFASQIKTSTRFHRIKLQGLMKKGLKTPLPANIINHRKSNLTSPLARWLREDLHDMVHDLLSENRIRDRGYIKPSYASWLISEHESGRRDFADQIYALLVLEIWFQNRNSTTYDDVTIEA